MSRMDLVGELTMTVVDCGVYRAVEVSGEIDIATGHLLRCRLAAVIGDGGTTPLIIDMTEVSFCDSQGLAIVVAAKRHAEFIALTGPSARMRQVLRITGLDRLLPVYPTLVEAVRDLTCP